MSLFVQKNVGNLDECCIDGGRREVLPNYAGIWYMWAFSSGMVPVWLYMLQMQGVWQRVEDLGIGLCII